MSNEDSTLFNMETIPILDPLALRVWDADQRYQFLKSGNAPDVDDNWGIIVEDNGLRFQYKDTTWKDSDKHERES